MGVGGLWDRLNKCCAGAFSDVGDLRAHQDQVWVIDVSMFMYRFTGASPDSEPPIEAFLEQVALIRGAGIEPRYLFDGERNPAKEHEHRRRKHQARKMVANSNRRAKFLAELEATASAAGEALPPPPPEPTAEEKAAEGGPPPVPAPAPLHADVAAKVHELATAADAPPDLRRAFTRANVVEIAGLGALSVEVDAAAVVQQIQMRHARETTLRDSGRIRIPDAHYHALMRAFDHEGVGYYIADGEAEQLGAELVRTGAAHVLVTDDGDALAFGAPRILRNLFREGKNGMQFVDLEKVLDALQLTYDQFVDVCVMSGCDFTNSIGIPNIGMATGTKLIQKHGSLEKYLASPEWKVKLGLIQASAKWADWDPADFDHELAVATFKQRGDGMVAYTSKAIDPDAAPIPEMERHGAGDLVSPDRPPPPRSSAAAAAPAAAATVVVAGVAYGGGGAAAADVAHAAVAGCPAAKKRRTDPLDHESPLLC